MSKHLSLQLYPGKGLGWIVLGASLHDILTRLKAQPHLYPSIDVSYSPAQSLVAPSVLNLPANGFRLRFDGPDQRLRLIEILDFGKTQLSYKNIDLVKLPEEQSDCSNSARNQAQHGPAFRHVYNRLMGPTFPGEYIPPRADGDIREGLYVLSYPGIAFTFPLQTSAWAPNADFVSLLSSSAAAPAKSLAIFNGASWQEARHDLFTRPCLNPRSLALSMKGKEYQPDEVDLINICGAGVLDLIRRSSQPFRLVLGQTTPQDLVAELGPPDAIYRKNDHRLSIHKPRHRGQRSSHGSYGASPARSDDFIDADQSSAHTTTDDSEAEDDGGGQGQDQPQSTAKCFYNYFHHGFDVFISYPSNPSPPFPKARSSSHSPSIKPMERLVATKILLHGNVPGSYPFNRYRRSRWMIDPEAIGSTAVLDSETGFTELSHDLRGIWQGNYASAEAEKATQHAIVLDRDWGDSPGSSYEVLEDWDDGEQTRKKGSSGHEGSGSGTTQIFGFPGMLFEVLKNDPYVPDQGHYMIELFQNPSYRTEDIIICSNQGYLRSQGLGDMSASGKSKSAEAPTAKRASEKPDIQRPWTSRDAMLSPTRALRSNTWKQTLLLPYSSFPPRPLLQERAKYRDRCSTELYKRQRTSRNPTHDKPFVLHDGPPFANGPLHIGHALNKILKDITCRFQVSLGKKVHYVPGWDCHGLPIENKVLEVVKAQNPGFDVKLATASQIREAAKKLAEHAVAKQRETFQQWGIMADWENAWKTMDWDYEMRQLSVFSNLVKAGFIHRREKPVYWSPSSETALAEAELHYRENHVSTAAYVAYPMDYQPQIDGKTLSVRALIWTTTPWTLPANRAIAVHKDIEYCVVSTAESGCLVIARSRLEEVAKMVHLGEDYEILMSIMGHELVGQTYQDAVFGAELPIRHVLHAAFVSEATGTGMVHIAPGHGMDDYELCQQHNISGPAPVDSAGRFTASQHHTLAGQEVLAGGTEAVLRLLYAQDYLMSHGKHQHRYPYDWRTHKPVIVRATPQWFADMGPTFQSAAVDALASVKFIPESGRDRLKGFVTSRPEWCISRQRVWGVPIPALYHKTTGEAILTPESVDHIISEIRTRGTNVWWSDPEDDPRWIEPSLVEAYGSGALSRGKDTMDVWFDSGTSWTQMNQGDDTLSLPTADVYLEGTDQHRGWFQSSLLTYVAQGAALDDEKADHRAPFDTLITHGFVLDEKGNKMSKSLGNVVSPDAIITGSFLSNGQETGEALGPDTLRLWVASSDYTSDVKVNKEVVKNMYSVLKKYRITFKFLLGNLQHFSSASSRIDVQNFECQHRIALIQLQETFAHVHNCYGRFEYAKAMSEIDRYVTKDLSAFYFEMIKDALYLDRGVARDNALRTLSIIFQCLQCMLAPVTPLLIEETWDYLPQTLKDSWSHPMYKSSTKTLRLLDQFQDSQMAIDMPILEATDQAIKKVQEIARQQKKMGSSLGCYVMIQTKNHWEEQSSVMACYERHLLDLAAVFVVSQVEIYKKHPPQDRWKAEWIIQEDFVINGDEVVVYLYAPDKDKCSR
ncbi:MAG: hypothetical protein Q9174_004468, partial [Haloplaca sp. 1 TL-2023]